MKCFMRLSDWNGVSVSPSMRREWIEIHSPPTDAAYASRSPSMRREWIEIIKLITSMYKLIRSPSMRREWIEIFPTILQKFGNFVSLHAEGVD